MRKITTVKDAKDIRAELLYKGIIDCADMPLIETVKCKYCGREYNRIKHYVDGNRCGYSDCNAEIKDK